MEPILEIKNLNSFYRQGGSAFSKGRTVQVLKNVNLSVSEGYIQSVSDSVAQNHPAAPDQDFFVIHR